MDSVPAKKQMPWWGILLIVVGSFVLLGALAIGGIERWLDANKDRFLEEAKKATEEGQSFAANHDQSACLEEGLRKASGCGGVMCETQARVFTSACAHQAKRTPGFCDGVPRWEEPVRTGLWSVEECRRRGFGEDQRCARQLHGLAQICADPKAH